MEFKFIEVKEKYDGSQLVSLRSYLKHKILGDSIVAWIGACDIPFEHMVDGEDLNAGAVIRGDRMVHFIVEKFDSSLLAAVCLQRLLASIVRDYLMEKAGERELAGTLYRSGDDIYASARAGGGAKAGMGGKALAGAKLSISIATQSPVSSLIHFAVNVTNKGTPVKTLSLEDLDVEPKKFAMDVMKRFTQEVQTIREATMKVRWVK
jgi:hypothetical protein